MPISAADFDVAFEALLDRTACLVPKVEVFSIPGASDLWEADPLGLVFDFVAVGGGGGGGAVGNASGDGTPYGGGGGGAGAYTAVRFYREQLAETIMSLTVAVGAGGLGAVVGPGVVGGITTITGGGIRIAAEGGYPGRSGVDQGLGGLGGGAIVTPTLQTAAGQLVGAYGGQGSPATINGRDGRPGLSGAAGIGANTVSTAQGGKGYGGGGGGGGFPGFSGPGGGGGAGGYAGTAAGVAGGATAGSPGAGGLVIIVTWRGVPI